MLSYFVKLAVSVIFVTLLVMSDQASKQFVVHFFQSSHGGNLTLFPGLDLSLSFNKGISFSLGATHTWFPFFVFCLISFIICCLIVILLVNADNLPINVSLSFILGGALGNYMDRVYYGAVTDFIDVYYGDSHFAMFNFADCYVTIGAIMFLYFTFIDPPPYYDNSEVETKNSDDEQSNNKDSDNLDKS